MAGELPRHRSGGSVVHVWKRYSRLDLQDKAVGSSLLIRQVVLSDC